MDVRAARAGWVLVLSVCASVALAEPARTPRGPDPLFADTAPLRVTIRGPLRTLAADKSTAPEYKPATLSYTEADGRALQFDIRLRVRGHSRRRQDVCNFPPLRVDLPRRPELRGTVFQGQNKLKLVTFCRHGDRHQQVLFKEHLTYLLFNQLTDDSFRVRLLEIDYVDSDRNETKLTRWGFFIEDNGRLGRRLGMPLREPDAIERNQLEPVQAGTIELFNFLIGNTDYSLIAAAPGRTCCHNSVLLEMADGRFMPVPYDFDMTGFVDPPYQMVSPELRIRNVRQRLYRGFCREGDYQRQAVQRLLEAKPGMLELVRTDPRLDQSSRNRALAYLESGFAILADPRQLERQVLMACR